MSRGPVRSADAAAAAPRAVMLLGHDATDPAAASPADASSDVESDDVVSHDVVIVGAGPVGLLLAVLLRQAGVDVVVLERRGGPSRRSRAIGIHPPSLAVLECAGLRDAVLDRAVLIAEGTAGADGRVLGRMRFAVDRSARTGAIATLPQPETERLLRERLAESGGVLRFGSEVVGVSQVAGGVVVEAVDAASGARSRLRSRCVVGADGVHSLVRASAGIGWRRLGRRRRYAMADFDDARAASADGVAALWFERGGVVESFPIPGGRRWVAWLARDERAETIARFASIVRARSGLDPLGDRRSSAPAAADSERGVSEFIAEQHCATRFVRGRLLLVGDAAHQISPIGGQGMNLGWLDVAALAPILIDALRPAAASDPGSSAVSRRPGVALAAWSKARRRAARRAQRRARFNMMMGAPAGAVMHAARCLAIRVLAGGPWNAALARAFTMRDL